MATGRTLSWGAIGNLETAGFQSSKITIKDSTFADNTAEWDGGAVAINSAAPKDIINNTFVGNTARQRQGGAVSVPNGGTANITSSTFVDNVAVAASAAQGLYGRSAIIKGALFAGAPGKPTCFFEDVSSVDDSSVSTGTGCGSATTVTYDSLNLLGLGSWGGPTPTVWIGPGSSAIGVNNGTCPATDQRGAARTAPCDAGAFERQGSGDEPTTGSFDYPATVELLATASPLSTPSVPSPGGRTFGYQALSPSTCSVNAGNGSVTGAALGTCSARWYVAPTLTLAGAIADDTLAVTKITQAPLVITSGSGPLVPGDGLPLTSSGGSGTGAISYSVGSSTGCAISGSNVVALNAWGSCAVTAIKAADDTYAAAQSNPVTITLQKAAQTALTIVAPTSLPVGQSATLSTTGGTTAGTVSYGASPSSTCRVTGSTLTMSATGACQVSATMAGDDTYLPVSATPVVVTGTEPPPPDPTLMPGPPRGVTARVTDTGVVVSWEVPSYTGAFPVSTYQVISSPGGASRLASVPTTTCAFNGLARGLSYTFTVRALNGIGWGAFSAPSNAVVAPRAQITAKGSRDGVRVRISGSTTGISVGTRLTLRYRILRGSTSPWLERMVVTASDGTFEWSRRSKAAVRVVVTGGGARSQLVTIPAR